MAIKFLPVNKIDFPFKKVGFIDRYEIFPSQGLNLLAGNAKMGKSHILRTLLLCSSKSVFWFDLDSNKYFYLPKKINEKFLYASDFLNLNEKTNKSEMLFSQKVDFETFLGMIETCMESIFVIDSYMSFQARVMGFLESNNSNQTNLNIAHIEMNFLNVLRSKLEASSALYLIHHLNKMGDMSGTHAQTMCSDSFLIIKKEKNGSKSLKRIGRYVDDLEVEVIWDYPNFDFSEKTLEKGKNNDDME